MAVKTTSKGPKPKRKRRPQERGNVRRQKLLQAAESLLGKYPLDQVTYQDIADHAGLPLGSCYHFYRSKSELLRSLIRELAPRLRQAVIEEPWDISECSCWQDLHDRLIDRAVTFYNSNPAACETMFGMTVPSVLSVEARLRDYAWIEGIRKVFELHFDLPDIPGLDRAFFIWLELMDKVLQISFMENGRITEEGVREARLVGRSYLEKFLPSQLRKRTHMPSTLEAGREMA